jgi:hypothetical protein
LLVILFSSHHMFLLSVQNEQSKWKICNFYYGEEQLSGFSVNSR